eukprot:9820150-Lingulodinium_polyedra.AAC.1
MPFHAAGGCAAESEFLSLESFLTTTAMCWPGRHWLQRDHPLLSSLTSGLARSRLQGVLDL